MAPTVPDGTTHADCIAAVEAAGKLLENLGHDVEVAQPPALREAEFSSHFLTLISAASAADFQTFGALIGRPLTADDVEPDNWRFKEIGESIRAPAYISCVNWFHAWSRRMAAWWSEDGFDILVTPTLAAPPPKLGWLSDPELGGGRVAEFLLFTAQFNVTGQPAISLPLHHSADGLPIGVQFVGAYAREDLLIRLATQIESAAPWADRTPPVWAAAGTR